MHSSHTAPPLLARDGGVDFKCATGSPDEAAKQRHDQQSAHTGIHQIRVPFILYNSHNQGRQQDDE